MWTIENFAVWVVSFTFGCLISNGIMWMGSKIIDKIRSVRRVRKALAGSGRLLYYNSDHLKRALSVFESGNRFKVERMGQFGEYQRLMKEGGPDGKKDESL